MSEPILYKGAFIVDRQLSNEPVEKYLERVLFKFEEHLSARVPVMSQGHYQVIEVSSAGTSNVLIKPQHRITNVVLQPLAGSGAYIHNFKLTEERSEDSKDGDKVIFYVAAPASTNPTVKILDQDDNIIASKTFTGSGNDSSYITTIKLNDLWRV